LAHEMYQGIGGKMEKVIQENSINMDIVVLIKTKKKKVVQKS